MCRMIVLAALALPLYRQVLPVDNDEQAIEKFEALIKAGQFSEVREQLETYTAVHTHSWQALYQLGYVYFRLHQIQPSLTMLSRSLATHSQFGEAHKVLAFDLNILGRKDLAIAELEKAINLTSNPWESRYELGRIYYEQGAYLKAVDQFEKAKALAPEFVKIYHNLGLAYAGTGNGAKAVENFEEGIRLNAKQKAVSAWPFIDYATYCNLQGDFPKARALLLQAIQIDSSWAQEFEELSKAYRGLGQTDEAINSLKRAISINPKKAETHYMLAQLYSQAHRSEEAKQELAEYERTRQQIANSQ
ncbi:MAG: tetratricopeptide repeat protein [Acidobacteriaceae bacterium]|nr:tetratricopeptide repeat protein [Acidobacteriaceae bacterium]